VTMVSPRDLVCLLLQDDRVPRSQQSAVATVFPLQHYRVPFTKQGSKKPLTRVPVRLVMRSAHGVCATNVHMADHVCLSVRPHD
jgi:hypothetical protein